MGGGANINLFNEEGKFTGQTLGSIMVKDIKQSIGAESVTGLNVILSMDPRLSIL